MWMRHTPRACSASDCGQRRLCCPRHHQPLHQRALHAARAAGHPLLPRPRRLLQVRRVRVAVPQALAPARRRPSRRRVGQRNRCGGAVGDGRRQASGAQGRAAAQDHSAGPLQVALVCYDPKPLSFILLQACVGHDRLQQPEAARQGRAGGVPLRRPFGLRVA
jgi:hypothetical protein